MINEGIIMVVEDTQASLKLLTDILVAEGYQVRPADSGELALASIEVMPPELILLDIIMPGMDGFEVLLRLKAKEETRDIPVILLSAITEVEQRVKGLKLGAVDFISKPLQPEELLARVRNHMELFRLRLQLEHQTADLRLANEQLQNDISKRKEVEEALIRSERLLNETGKMAKVGGWEFDVDTRQQTWTEEVYRIHEVDFSFHPTVEKGINFYHPESRSHIEKAVQRAIDHGEPFDLELRIVTSKGNHLWVRAIGKTIQKNGKILKVFGTFQDITERKRAEEKIQASLLEKETLLKEIHHRVKNNLSVISSLLGLQSRYLKDEKSREIFRESQDRIKVMATIHTLLYQSKDLGKVDFGSFIKKLAGRLQQSYGTATSSIEIYVDIADVSLDIDISIPCGLILNELVSNALKYAFPEGRGGTIHIGLTTDGDRCVLQIQDNGIGFPEAMNFRNTKSLGLELVNLLVGQIDGTIDLAVDGGTTFTIIFFMEKLKVSD